MPRLRSLPFETEIIERYRRREISVEEALVEMYLAGVSVRRVEDITQALWGTTGEPEHGERVKPEDRRVQIEEWRNRPIEGQHPYVFLDGIWLKRSWGGEVKNVSVLVAIGVDRDGTARCWAFGGGEGGQGRVAELPAAAEGARPGRRTAVHVGQVSGPGRGVGRSCSRRRCGSGASCISIATSLAVTPKGRAREVAAMLKAIHAQEDRAAAQAKAEQVVEKLRAMRLGQAADIVAGGHRRDADLHGFPARALDAAADQQCPRADHAGDPPADAGGRELPRRPSGYDLGRGPPAAHRRHQVGRPRVLGHEPLA